MSLEGIDVSGYNPGTNWNLVKSQKEFAFIKCTEGLTYTNKYFKSDWANSQTSGVIRGAYHFFHPHDDPIKQAQFFLLTMGELTSKDLPPVIDLETHELTAQQEVNNALIFLETIQKSVQKTPIIYSGFYYINELGNPQAFAKYPLWLADYEAIPKIPKPWSSYTFWQYSSSGNVNGVSGKADLSVYQGDMNSLMLLCNYNT